MGQAFRRAAGTIRSTSVDSTPSSSLQLKKAAERRQPSVPRVDEASGSNVGHGADHNKSRGDIDNVIEERDPQYDAMLRQMVGRIQAKPGGKTEMGEAFVVEKHSRPLPKLRNTTLESSRYEERPTPLGTLNVAQLRHIILLRQGKADDHDGPMEIDQIAEKFRVDVAQIQNILQFVSLPPESSSKKTND